MGIRRRGEKPVVHELLLWGNQPTEGELEALAGPLRTDVASLRASIELAVRSRAGQPKSTQINYPS
jgi:hypothetical protein